MKQNILKHSSLALSVLFLFGCGGTEAPNTSVTSYTQLAEFVDAPTFEYVSEAGTQVGIEISTAEGVFDHYLVTLEGENQTAWDALQATGIETVTADFGWGVAICAIDGVGRLDDICFNDIGEEYWGFLRLDEGEWISAEVGVSDYVVSDGEVIGFVWAK